MIRRRPAMPLAAVATLFAALVQSCGSSAPTTPGGGSAVASLAITPTSDTVVAGQTAQLTASVKDASGAAMTGQTIIWSTSPTAIATVNDVGVVTGVTPGTATVTATSGGKSATSSVTVAAGAMIPTSGGTVSTIDGAVTLTFPPGAVAAPTAVRVSPAVGAPPSSSLLGTTYDFGPTGTQFAQPVMATVKYDPAKLPTGAVLQLIQLYTAVGGQWAVVPGSTVDTIAHTVTAPLSHFSIYSPCIYGCQPPSTESLLLRTDGCGFSACPMTVPLGGIGPSETGTVYWNGVPSAFRFTVGPVPPGVTSAITTAGGTWSISFGTTGATPIGTFATYVKVELVSPPSDAPGIFDAMNVDVTVLAPGYTITPGGSGLSVAQGANISTSITLARAFWTGDVTLAATNLPAGVTASFAPNSIPGNASTMTLNASASTPAGNSTFTIRGTSPNHADVTTTVGLTVTPGTGFTIAGTPAFATVAQGGSGSTGLQVTRTNFGNSIAYTFVGLPAGVTAAVAATTVADSNRLTFTATGGATPGTYPITVTGTSGSTVRNTTISLVVSSPGSTIVQADFSNCNVSQRPVWVVYQDGSNPYAQATGNGTIFPITFTSARGVIAAVIPTLGGSFTTVVNYGTPAELLTLPWNCNDVAFGAGKGIGVSATGMLPNDFGDIGLGGVYDGSLTFEGPSVPVDSVSLVGVADGVQDLIAYRYHSTVAGTDVRWAIRRDLNISNNGAAATIDFNGPESFAPTTGNFSVAAGGEQPTMQFAYVAGTGCFPVRYGVNVNHVAAPLNGNTFYGVPAAQQRPGDLHMISVSTPTRFAANFFHTVTQATVALNLGGGMPTPTITAPSGPYKRLQAVFAQPIEYVFTKFWYGAGIIQAGSGYFGSGTTTLAMPDLTGVAGYNPSWFPVGVSNPFPWTLAGYSIINPAAACFDGGNYRSSGHSGMN